jgi:hypothetical protein
VCGVSANDKAGIIVYESPEDPAALGKKVSSLRSWAYSFLSSFSATACLPKPQNPQGEKKEYRCRGLIRSYL